MSAIPEDGEKLEKKEKSKLKVKKTEADKSLIILGGDFKGLGSVQPKQSLLPSIKVEKESTEKISLDEPPKLASVPQQTLTSSNELKEFGLALPEAGEKSEINKSESLIPSTKQESIPETEKSVEKESTEKQIDEVTEKAINNVEFFSSPFEVQKLTPPTFGFSNVPNSMDLAPKLFEDFEQVPPEAGFGDQSFGFAKPSFDFGVPSIPAAQKEQVTKTEVNNLTGWKLSGSVMIPIKTTPLAPAIIGLGFHKDNECILRFRRFGYSPAYIKKFFHENEGLFSLLNSKYFDPKNFDDIQEHLTHEYNFIFSTLEPLVYGN